MSQILNGRGVSAVFDTDGLHLDHAEQRVDIPLTAVRGVRTPEARVVEITLTDGVTHRVEGGNPTATAAFAAALTAALPAERAQAGSSLVTTTDKPRGSTLFRWVLAAPLLGYLAYTVWVGVTHGWRVLGVIIGILPLGAGLLFLGAAIEEAVRRIALSRRGITVLAHSVGTSGKKDVVYEYTDVEGREHTYTCRRKAQRTQLTYDSRNPGRAAHAMWLPFAVGKVFVGLTAGLFWLFVGVAMAFGLLW